MLSALCISTLTLSFAAFGQRCPTGVVVDADDLPVPAATVIWRLGEDLRVLTNARGEFAFRCSPVEQGGSVHAIAGGQSSAEMPAGEDIRLVLRSSVLQQAVIVSTTRTGDEVGPEAQTIVVLDAAQLRRYAALTLDERLRQVAGFELFRRTASWAANPTSEGVSLRGLGSTAASRSLVLTGGVVGNDGFGGWVHWNELPPEVVEGVSVAEGGGSDLYGSSALGGVVDVVTGRPVMTQVSGAYSVAAEDTSDGHGRVDLVHGPWGGLFAGEGFRTAGYVPIAPSLAGAVDRPANVHFQNGRVAFDREGIARGRSFLNGNLLNEARGNGTELQTNGTRLWRWAGGQEWKAASRWSGRGQVFGSEEGYRQTFSSIDASRSVEMLTRLQRAHTQEVGGSADATVQGWGGALVMGADLRDLRANDVEAPVSAGVTVTSVQATEARQRFTGGFVEGLLARSGWSGAASVRVDSAANLDTSTRAFTPAGEFVGANAVPYRSEILASPRVGLVRALPRGWQLHAEGFRAFRAPTMNELYRPGQVGQETTLANSALRSERGTGVEGGARWQPGSGAVSAQASYFWTAINRPVSAVLVRRTATALTNQRENLGQIQSQGVDLRLGLFAGRAVSANIGYQYAHAVVTSFSVQPALVGRWIPDVPRQSLTAQVRAERERWGALTFSLRASGQAFDDSSNLYPLARFVSADVYGEHALGRGWFLFAAVQNLFDQRIQVARTPVLSLGNPVLAQGGVRWSYGHR